MSETYEDYEQEFQEHLSRIRSFLTSQARSQTTLRQCDLLLTHAKRCANAMLSLAAQQQQQQQQGNVNNVNQQPDAFQLSQAQQRIREMEPLIQEVNRARKEQEDAARGVFEIQEDEEEKRQRLFGYQPPDVEGGGGTTGGGGMTTTDTQALIQNSENLLLDSQALCAESDQIGSETLFHMGRQRDQLENASGYMTGANAVIDQAREILEAMNQRALRNKRVLYGIILLLIIANVAVIIAIAKKKK